MMRFFFNRKALKVFNAISEVRDSLGAQQYIASDEIATTMFLAERLGKPVLTEGPLVLCESRAILDHLEETYPEPALLGREPGERAEARRLLQWFDRKFDYEVGGFILHEKMEKRLLGLGAPDLASLRQGREALRGHKLYIDTLLADRDWLAGTRLSLADFAAAAHLSVIDYFGDVPWADFQAVKTWYMKLKSRPAFRPLLADRWPGLAPAPHYDDLDF